MTDNIFDEKSDISERLPSGKGFFVITNKFVNNKRCEECDKVCDGLSL